MSHLGDEVLEQLILSQIVGTNELWDLILDRLQIEQIDQLNSGFPEGHQIERFWNYFKCLPEKVGEYSPQLLQYIMSTLRSEKRGSFLIEEIAIRPALELRGAEYERLYGVKLEHVCIMKPESTEIEMS